MRPVRLYIILLIKGTLIYRIADDGINVLELLVYDPALPEVIPLGYCNSVDWLMEWQVQEGHELRVRLSGKVLELINYIRQTHHE